MTAARQVPRVPLPLLAMFTLSGTLAMHVFIPALPLAAEGLGASAGTMQLTISLYIAGLAIGQLVYGPLSDRHGRRPVLMAGLALYTVAGLAAALSHGVGSLIAARLFQALGGCAGLVLGRAIVRDMSSFEESARRLAIMNLMVTAGPGVAPIIGAALASTLGWRSVLYALVVLGAVNLACSWRLLRETNPKARRAGSDSASVYRNYLRLLRSPAFLCYAIGGGCATTALYALITTAPFIFVHQLHRPAHEVGLSIALMISGMLPGSVLATRLMRKVSIRHMLTAGNAICLSFATLFLVGAWSGQLTLAWATGSIFMFTMGVAFVSPAAQAEALSVHPDMAGSASGVYGFAQMGIGALCSGVVGLGSNPAIAAGLVLFGGGLLAQIAFRIAAGQTKPGTVNG